MRSRVLACVVVWASLACRRDPPPAPRKPAAADAGPRPAQEPAGPRRPVTRMGLAKVLRALPTPALRATGTTLLVESAGVLRSGLLGAPTLGTVVVGPGAAVAQLRGSSFVAKGLVMGLVDASEAVALDATTGRERWRARVYEAGPVATTLASVASAGDAMLLTFTRLEVPAAAEPARAEVVALGASDGVVRWRHAFEQAPAAVAVYGQRAFVLEREGRVTALDAGTGAVAWQHAVEGAVTRDDTLLADRDVLAWAGPEHDLRLLDAGTGALRTSVALPGRSYASHPPAAEGGLAVVPVSSPPAPAREALGEVRFVAIDLATGRVRWESAPTRGPRRPSLSAPVIDRDAVYTCGADDVLRAHDPATGEVRWQWGVGGCNTVTPMADVDARALALAVAWGGDAVAVFRRGAQEPPPPERATIAGAVRARGRPEAGRVVLVGAAVARTDRAGRYSATVEARGLVRVALPFEEHAQERFVELTGARGAYDASFALEDD